MRIVYTDLTDGYQLRRHASDPDSMDVLQSCWQRDLPYTIGSWAYHIRHILITSRTLHIAVELWEE